METLVTIQVHQRDVFADLAKIFKERKSIDASDFAWLQQARCYWRPNATDRHGAGAAVISVSDVDFTYSFEYLGCKERLVITPLTDRCYGERKCLCLSQPYRSSFYRGDTAEL